MQIHDFKMHRFYKNVILWLTLKVCRGVCGIVQINQCAKTQYSCVGMCSLWTNLDNNLKPIPLYIMYRIRCCLLVHFVSVRGCVCGGEENCLSAWNQIYGITSVFDNWKNILKSNNFCVVKHSLRQCQSVKVNCADYAADVQELHAGLKNKQWFNKTNKQTTPPVLSVKLRIIKLKY